MKLELLYFESCPFCQKVLMFIRNKHNIILKDTRMNKVYKEELLKATGKLQVPCLLVDGKPLLESNDIVEFLDNNRIKWERRTLNAEL